MKKRLIASLMLTLSLAALHAANGLPTVLLFPVAAGDGAQPTVATEATQAIKTYLRQTGKAEVADFDPDSALVRRAVMEHRVKTEQLVGVSTPEARLQIGKLIGTDFAVTGDVSIKDDRVTSSIWLGNVRTRKVWRLEASAGIASAGDRDRAVSNALQSATSTVIYQLAGEALKDIPPDAAALAPVEEDKTTAVNPIEPQVLPPGDEAKARLDRAQKFEKAGDDASAILEYRKAINADPRSIETRLALVRLYVQRKMYAQATDELGRAQEIEPDNEAVRRELARVYEDKGAFDKAAEVYTREADRHPNDPASRVAAGDYYWRHNKFEDAEKQYRLAVEIDPANPAPHDRLALLLAAQSLFNESRKEVQQLQKLDPNPDPKVMADRYTRLRSLADRDLKALVVQYDNGADSFSDRSMTRESYYELVRGIGVRLGSITHFLEALTPTVGDSSAHRRRILGCNLMSQACAHMLSYLETNKSSERQDAAIFISEAKKHITEP